MGTGKNIIKRIILIAAAVIVVLIAGVKLRRSLRDQYQLYD